MGLSGARFGLWGFSLGIHYEGPRALRVGSMGRALRLEVWALNMGP